MRVDLDTCCLNRLLDVTTQERVLREADAVARIIRQIESGKHTLVGSRVLVTEIAARPDERSRDFLFARLMLAAHWTPVQAATIARGEALERMGFHLFDALHIACAEQAADVFLTTDDRLLRRAMRLSTQLGTTVSNPAEWMKEVR